MLAVTAALWGVAAFAACGGDDASSGGGDDASATTSDSGGDSSQSSDGTQSSDGIGPLPDGGGGDSAAGDAAPSDAAFKYDGPCTPRVGTSFVCGAASCTNSTTQYCIYGAVPNTCQPLPPACQCEETFNCACLAANLDCDGGFLCSPHSDAGAAELPDAAYSSFFWIASHTCSVR